METFLASLARGEGKSLVPEQTDEQANDLWVIETPWRSCNESNGIFIQNP